MDPRELRWVAVLGFAAVVVLATVVRYVLDRKRIRRYFAAYGGEVLQIAEGDFVWAALVGISGIPYQVRYRDAEGIERRAKVSTSPSRGVKIDEVQAVHEVELEDSRLVVN